MARSPRPAFAKPDKPSKPNQVPGMPAPRFVPGISYYPTTGLSDYNGYTSRPVAAPEYIPSPYAMELCAATLQNEFSKLPSQIQRVARDMLKESRCLPVVESRNTQAQLSECLTELNAFKTGQLQENIDPLVSAQTTQALQGSDCWASLGN
eukprot:g83301.t1